jgi:hypothetical protein
MGINFRTHEISRDARKLTRTSTLIKKKKNIWRSGDETEEKKSKKKRGNRKINQLFHSFMSQSNHVNELAR